MSSLPSGATLYSVLSNTQVSVVKLCSRCAFRIPRRPQTKQHTIPCVSQTLAFLLARHCFSVVVWEWSGRLGPIGQQAVAWERILSEEARVSSQVRIKMPVPWTTVGSLNSPSSTVALPATLQITPHPGGAPNEWSPSLTVFPFKRNINF